MLMIGCWSFTSWQQLRKHHDGYLLVTLCTHGNAIASTGKSGHQHDDPLLHSIIFPLATNDKIVRFINSQVHIYTNWLHAFALCVKLQMNNKWTGGAVWEYDPHWWHAVKKPRINDSKLCTALAETIVDNTEIRHLTHFKLKKLKHTHTYIYIYEIDSWKARAKLHYL